MQKSKVKTNFTLCVLSFALCSTAMGAEEKKDTILVKYKIEPKKGVFKVKVVREEKFPLEDILDKKVYTKGIAAARFGGERRISLERGELIKRIEKPSPLLKELPSEAKREKAELKREELEVEVLEPEKLKVSEIERVIPEVTPLVLPTVEVEDKEAMKLSAIKVLGEIKEPSSVSLLKESLEEEKPEVKRAAAEALAKIGEPAGLAALHEALKEKEVESKVEAIRAIGRVGKVTSIPPLRELLSSEESKVSREAAFALAKIGDEKGVTLLHELLKVGSFDDRFEVAVALAEAGDKAGLSELKQALTDSRASIRYTALKALGKVGDRSLIPMLESIMKDDVDARVRIAASESILMIQKEGNNELSELWSRSSERLDLLWTLWCQHCGIREGK